MADDKSFSMGRCIFSTVGDECRSALERMLSWLVGSVGATFSQQSSKLYEIASDVTQNSRSRCCLFILDGVFKRDTLRVFHRQPAPREFFRFEDGQIGLLVALRLRREIDPHAFHRITGCFFAPAPRLQRLGRLVGIQGAHHADVGEQRIMMA
jgi:hypothetical protein